jgi:hypothetical protein
MVKVLTARGRGTSLPIGPVYFTRDYVRRGFFKDKEYPQGSRGVVLRTHKFLWRETHVDLRLPDGEYLLEVPIDYVSLPPAATGRRSVGWGAIAAGVVAVVVVGYSDIAGAGSSTGGRSTVTPTTSSATSAPSPTRPKSTRRSSFTPAQKKLLHSVHHAHDRCEPLGISDPRLRPKLVTALRCDPKSQRPDYLDYLQYPTKRAMESVFKKYARNPGSSGCTSSEADPDSTTETVDHRCAIVWEDETDQTKYKGACFTRGGVRLCIWYDMDFSNDEEEPWILHTAGSKTMTYSKLSHWMTDPFR